MNNTIDTISLDKVGKVKMCKRILKEQTSSNEEIPFEVSGGQLKFNVPKLLCHQMVELRYS